MRKDDMYITKLSIIIPVYNEGNTIHLLLDRVREVNLLKDIVKELIVVNDCSIDDTEQSIENYITKHASLDIKYFKHKFNLGKGAALHTGISKATGEFLIIQDAD